MIVGPYSTRSFAGTFGTGWRQTARSRFAFFDLNEAALRDPSAGIGKPEPLKFELAGCWSRRITQEHRLVYRVTQNRIDFLHARYHY